ncbi:hypothetical protein MMC13_005549 [Lambiella insularis]|nr:hypothetical protein [Lambiella insularis]
MDYKGILGKRGLARAYLNRSTKGSSKAAADLQRGIKELFLRKRGARSKDASKSNEVFWPLDLLPQDCSNSRILTWGYDSMVIKPFRAVNQSNIIEHAKNLLNGLWRTHCQGRKLIFIAHSLGIIVKEVLRRAAKNAELAFRDIYTSTEAIVFLGTPHHGSTKAGNAEDARRLASLLGFDTTDHNIRALQVDSTELQLIHEEFIDLYQKGQHFKVFTFQESKGVAGTSFLKLNKKVVKTFSSSLDNAPSLSITANHRSICRFPNRDDEGYQQVSAQIQEYVSNIQRRKEQDVFEKNKQLASLQARSSSQATIASAAYSFSSVERNCVALLTQNTANAAKYKSSLASPVKGTCKWILSNSQFANWDAQEGTCLLWISGYPGSGKTILSAYILEHLAEGDNASSLRTTLCYFFCDEKIGTQRDGAAILRSIIHQLLMRRRWLIKYVKSAYDVQGPQFEQNLNELWRIFIAIASDKQVGPVRVIIDAIDECEEITRKRLLRDVIELISKSQSAGLGTPCVKFLVTSRPLLGPQYTTNLLQIDPSQSHVEQDLRQVIQTKVNGIVERTRCNADVKTYLENALNSKADRTFLWVTLVLHLLEQSFLASQKDFKRIIDALPTSLTATYESYLHGIATAYQPLASKLLHFLVASSRTLTLEEMRVLIAIQDHHRSLADIEEDMQPNIQKTIEGVLGPLVRIWDSRVYLLHQSLKEYLQDLSSQKGNPMSATYGVDSREANLLLAKACVSYLLLNDLEEDILSQDRSSTEDSPTSLMADSLDMEATEEPVDPYNLGEDILFQDPAVLDIEACISIANQRALFDYSARHWAEHYSSACSISSRTFQESVLRLSDTSRPQNSNWLRYFWHYAEMDLSCPRDFVPFITATYFGHLTSLKVLLMGSLPIQPDIGACGIYWASRMGHHEVVDLLLEENFNPDARVNGQNALTAAVEFNRAAVVKRLLKDEGYISEEIGYRVNYLATGARTPLSIAAGNGLTAIATQLLQHDRIQPDIADSSQRTPPFWAVMGNHLDVLQLLLKDVRTSLNHVDKAGQNILSYAASAGELKLVEYLMGLKDLNAHEQDRNGRTALSWAAGNRHLETAIYLRRSQRVDVSITDNDGRNAISWACSGCHPKVIKYLIKHDPQGVDQEDVNGWAPLAWATFREAPKTVQVLLESGFVDVNRRDKHGRTALSWTAEYGYLKVLTLLLNTKGIEIESKDNRGITPLMYAQRHPNIVMLLQSALADR